MCPFTGEHDRFGFLVGERHTVVGYAVVNLDQRLVGDSFQTIGRVVDHKQG